MRPTRFRNGGIHGDGLGRQSCGASASSGTDAFPQPFGDLHSRKSTFDDDSTHAKSAKGSRGKEATKSGADEFTERPTHGAPRKTSRASASSGKDSGRHSPLGHLDSLTSTFGDDSSLAKSEEVGSGKSDTKIGADEITERPTHRAPRKSSGASAASGKDSGHHGPPGDLHRLNLAGCWRAVENEQHKQSSSSASRALSILENLADGGSSNTATKIGIDEIAERQRYRAPWRTTQVLDSKDIDFDL